MLHLKLTHTLYSLVYNKRSKLLPFTYHLHKNLDCGKFMHINLISKNLIHTSIKVCFLHLFVLNEMEW
jgi:hypothetical protein